MPKVQEYDNLQISPNSRPNTAVKNVVDATMVTAGARQMQEFGKASMQAGEAYNEINIDEQHEANQLRVDDALNQAKEQFYKLTYDPEVGYTNIKGAAALDRKGGKPLADEYGEKYGTDLSTIASGLGNDAQREMFGAASKKLVTNFKMNAMQHEGQEYQTYRKSVRTGTIANRTNDAAINYQNTAIIDESVESIRAATVDLGRQEGKSASEIEADVRTNTSAAISGAITSAIGAGDIAYANSLMNKYAPKLDTDTTLKMGDTISKETDSVVANEVSNQVMIEALPKISTPESDRAFNVALGTESNYQQFEKDGVTPLTSSAGAIGIAQVMPGTAPEAAKMAGLEWDEHKYKNDAEYNRALGKAYFDQQLKDFGGDLAKAYAAYNCGPGNVRKAMKKAEKEGTYMEGPDWGGQVPGPSDWLKYCPEETRDYVRKNINKYVAGGGNYTPPSLAELKADVTNRVGTENPRRLKLALDETERRYYQVTKKIQDQEEASTAEAFRTLEQNGGDFNSLPPAIRTNIPPAKVSSVMEFGQRIAKNEDATDLKLYNKLSVDSNYLQGLSQNGLQNLRPQLSAKDFQHFSTEWAKIKEGKYTNGPEQLNTEAINSNVNDRLRMMGMDPTPKDGTDDAARIGTVRKFINDTISVAQVQAGKKFTDTETAAYIDQIFAKTSSYETFWGNEVSGPMFGMKARNIPGDVKRKVTEVLKKKGFSSPTDAQILDTYWRLQLKPKKNTTGAEG